MFRIRCLSTQTLYIESYFPLHASLGATEQPKSTISKRMASYDFQTDHTPAHFRIINSGRPPLGDNIVLLHMRPLSWTEKKYADSMLTLVHVREQQHAPKD